MERLIQLLNHLRVTVEDVDRESGWLRLLLEILQSTEAAQHLSHWYWELLVELAISKSWSLEGEIAYTPQIITFLTEAQEWGKLECWIGTVWMV